MVPCVQLGCNARDKVVCHILGQSSGFILNQISSCKFKAALKALTLLCILVIYLDSYVMNVLVHYVLSNTVWSSNLHLRIKSE